MKKLYPLVFTCILAVVLSASFIRCSGRNVDENNPQALLDDAEIDIKDKRYLQALETLKKVKNKFPYSNLSKLAALRIADVNFLQEEFVEAATAYETFRDLHPKYIQADYVLFRIGESYFNQLPSTIDRDQTPAQKAINAFTELHSLYPASAHNDIGQRHLKESTEKLAKKEKYIADFYYIRDIYDSAASRFEKIVTKYANTSPEEYAYYYWGRSLIRQSQMPEYKDKKDTLLAESRHVFKTYVSRFPHGDYIKKIDKEIERMPD